MPREDFEAYTSGQLVPPITDSTNRCSHAVKSLEKSLEQLKELNLSSDHLLQRIENFSKSENEEWDKIAESIQKFRQEHPPGKTLDVAWLESSPDKEEL